MASVKGAGDRAKWLHWLARVAGTLVAGYWLLDCIFSGMNDPTPWGREYTILACLIVASFLGVAIAWWREGLGGAVVLGCAVAHSTFAYFAAGHSRGLAMLVSGGPFFLIGALFLASWRCSGKARPGNESGA